MERCNITEGVGRVQLIPQQFLFITDIRRAVLANDLNIPGHNLEADELVALAESPVYDEVDWKKDGMISMPDACLNPCCQGAWSLRGNRNQNPRLGLPFICAHRLPEPFPLTRRISKMVGNEFVSRATVEARETSTIFSRINPRLRSIPTKRGC